MRSKQNYIKERNDTRVVLSNGGLYKCKLQNMTNNLVIICLLAGVRSTCKVTPSEIVFQYYNG